MTMLEFWLVTELNTGYFHSKCSSVTPGFLIIYIAHNTWLLQPKASTVKDPSQLEKWFCTLCVVKRCAAALIFSHALCSVNLLSLPSLLRLSLHLISFSLVSLILWCNFAIFLGILRFFFSFSWDAFASLGSFDSFASLAVRACSSFSSFLYLTFFSIALSRSALASCRWPCNF